MAVSLTPCPRPGHAGNRTRKRGRVVVAGEYQQRRERVAPDGSVHHFQVLEDTEHAGAASIHFPPPCPDHLDSRVLRHGTYGKGTKQRQRYRCVPAVDERPHTFTPPLSREAVEYGVEDCDFCEALLSPHRGALTGARHTP